MRTILEVKEILNSYLETFNEFDTFLDDFELNGTETNEQLYNLAHGFHSECQTERAEIMYLKTLPSEYFDEELNDL